MTTTVDYTTISTDNLVIMLASMTDNEDAIDQIVAELDARDECAQDDVEDAELDENAQQLAYVDTQRKTGESRRRCVRRLFHEMTYERYIAAENATQGHLLNKAGLAADVDPYELFYGSARQAVKYASRELRDWWESNGRTTEIEFQARMLGYPQDVRRAAEARNHAQSLGL